MSERYTKGIILTKFKLIYINYNENPVDKLKVLID